MIELATYQPAEVVPRSEIEKWKKENFFTLINGVPPRVQEFIDALAAKMPDFGRYGVETFIYSGQNLLLSGMKEFKGKPIDPFASYNVEFPKLRIVNERSTMIRLYHKKGKTGLVDYLKARLSGTRLQKALDILSVEVFHERSRGSDYEKMMNEINRTKKIESEFE